MNQEKLEQFYAPQMPQTTPISTSAPLSLEGSVIGGGSPSTPIPTVEYSPPSSPANLSLEGSVIGGGSPSTPIPVISTGSSIPTGTSHEPETSFPTPVSEGIPGYIYDYSKETFVSATPQEIAARNQFYETYPNIAPPGTPDKSVPITKEQATKLDTQYSTFAEKWAPLIKNGEFIGTAKEYEQYKSEFEKLGETRRSFMGQTFTDMSKIVPDLSKLRGQGIIVSTGKSGEYSIDFSKAVAAGVTAEQLSGLGFLVDKELFGQAKSEYERYNELIAAQDKVSKFADSNGKITYYGVKQAIAAGVTVEQLKALGYTQDTIDKSLLPPPQEQFLAEYAKQHPMPDVMTKNRGALTPTEEDELRKVEPKWFSDAAKEYNKQYGTTGGIEAYTAAGLRQAPAKLGFITPTKVLEPTMGWSTVGIWDIPRDIGTAWLYAGAPGAGKILSIAGASIKKIATPIGEFLEKPIWGTAKVPTFGEQPFESVFGLSPGAISAPPAKFLYASRTLMTPGELMAYEQGLEPYVVGTIGKESKFFPAKTIGEAKAASLVTPYEETSAALAKVAKVTNQTEFEQALAYQQQLRVLPATEDNMVARVNIGNKINDYISTLQSTEAQRLAKIQAGIASIAQKAEHGIPQMTTWKEESIPGNWRLATPKDVPGTSNKEFVRDIETNKLYVKDVPQKQVVTSTKQKLYFPETAPSPKTTRTQLQYPSWERTPSGLWLLKFSGAPTVKTIVSEDVTNIFAPIDVPDKSIFTPQRIGTITEFPTIAPDISTLGERELVPIESPSTKFAKVTITTPDISFKPVPDEFAFHTPAIHPPEIVSIKTFFGKPPEPPAIQPPPILKFPHISSIGGSESSSGAGSRRGLKGIYARHFQKIPRMVVYMPGNESDEFENTAFGKKSVITVTKEARLRAGAKEIGSSYQSGFATAKKKVPARSYRGHELVDWGMGNKI